jgi:serine/threonine-protein kinase
MFVGLGVILGSAITGVSWWVSRTPSRPNLVTRFTLTLPEGEQITDPQHRTVAISPDGTRIAYVANRQLHLRSMSDSQGVVIASSELERGVGTPVFSPDSRSIAFVLGNTGGGNVIRKIEATGGTPITLTEVRSNNVLGLSWTGDDIVFADAGDGLVRVSSTTHKREVLVAPTRGQIIQGPILLPGGEVVLFALGQPSPGVDTPTADSWDTAKIVALRLRTGERKTLIEGGSDPHYVATGHLLYAVSGAMFAVRFDPKRLEVDGERVPILNGVGRTGIARTSTGMMQFSVSDTGSAIYLAPSSSTAVDPPKLMFVDRAGKAEPLKLPPGLYERPRISPDGTQLTFGSQDATGAKIWIYALSGVSAMRQLTFEGKNQFPIWSADGQHVAFQSDRDGDTAIFWQRSDGSTKAERLTRPDPGTTHVPESWSRDGDHFLYTVEKGGIKALWVFSMTAKKGEPFSAVQSRRLISPEFSPNSRWVAYTLTNPGMNQVFIEPFPATGAKRFLVGVGARPQWSPDGKELFFYNGDRTFVVTVTTDPGFATTEPVALPFNVYGGRGPGFGRDADIMPDGKRFVALVSPSTSSVAGGVGRQFDVVLNWTEELKQRVPSK